MRGCFPDKHRETIGRHALVLPDDQEAGAMSPTLTTADVAPMCGTTVPHIRKLARQELIPHYRIGGILKFDPDEIEAWLEARHVVPTQSAAS